MREFVGPLQVRACVATYIGGYIEGTAMRIPADGTPARPRPYWLANLNAARGKAGKETYVIRAVFYEEADNFMVL